MKHLLDTTEQELLDWLNSHGHAPYRVGQIRRWVFEKRADSFADMSDLPKKLREDLAGDFSLFNASVAKQYQADDGTEKLLVELADGGRIECVLLRDGHRRSICISTQVGCAMGCVFCATGQMGFARNLTVAEIFEQALQYARLLTAEGDRLSNVVLMGMGEPFHNYDASLAAIHLLMQRLGIGARHITVSTVGLVPQIRRFADEGLQVKLAISLHAATDEERAALLPVNKRYPLQDLIAACRDYADKTGRRVTFEWAAISGENDTPEQARALGQLLHGLKCHVNIIPLNPTGGYAGGPSSMRRVNAFIEALAQYGISA
ncbi:MAG: 23S rRNA (adenine(2503)-C(2))-methyltransferase RlmN, partial [Planctomycetales bacterium]|nr:23S rRNA (adenine(2503)-C(2))-methyltransferase RlmN [Planctomycetales bacterium]